MDNIVFLFTKFYFFFIILFLLGRAFIIINSKIFNLNFHEDSKLQGVDTQIFYPVLGMFFLGNFLYIFNYFLPLKNKLSYLILLFIFINFKHPIYYEKLKGILKTLPIYTVLLATSYDINFHYDAGLYHLNNQLWLNESNIVAGFSNIYGPYGVSSIYEYLSAFLWLDRSFMLVHFLSLIFIGFFYTFLLYNLIYNKNKHLFAGSFLLLIYSIFDNFGFSGGRNGFVNLQSIGKQDLAISVLFLVTSSLLTISILKKSFKIQELVIYSVLSLFIFQLKISGFSIAFIYFVYIYFYAKDNEISLLSLFNILKIYVILFFTWLIKSLIHTGCLIFPYEPSCLSSLKWVNKEYITNIENITVNFSNSYYFRDSLYTWGKEYISIPINFTVFMNFFISVFALLILSKILFFKSNELNKNKIIIPIVSLSILFYLRFGPDVRYISGLMMFLVFCVGIDRKIKIEIPKLILITVFIFSLLAFPKLQSYKSIDVFRNPSVSVPEESMRQLFDRLAPASGDQCWINIDCSANLENFKIDTSGYFKVATLNN